MKAIVIGTGKMGTLICSSLQEQGHEVLACSDVLNPQPVEQALPLADVILDFSHRDNVDWILPLAIKRRIPLVEGTTALTQEQIHALQEASLQIPLFFSSNYSLGIALLKNLAAQAAAVLKDEWDMEIVEKHHNLKKDAPSGTALSLLEAIDPNGEFEHVFGRSGQSHPRGKEIGIHAVRGGTLPGFHEVEFIGNQETLSLSHNAYSRQIFVNGALAAASFLMNQPAGLYGMDELVSLRLQK